jgi:hypothetical protein
LHTDPQLKRLYLQVRVYSRILLCLLGSVVSLVAQVSPTALQNRDVRVPRIQKEPLLEEFLGGASRSDMVRVDDFKQRQPHDGDSATRKTSAWMGYDDKHFYVVFVCESPDSQTRAHLAKREDVFGDDVVGIIFDTYHDRQRGYEFFVNPLGVQADATESDSADDDFSFDTLWYSEGRITPEGFTTRMKIPFRSLRFSPAESQTWGVALFRSIPTNNESSFWPYITHKVSGFNQQMANMSGMERISPGRNLQFIPYFAFGRSRFLDNPDTGIPSFRSKTDARVGLDAKAVIHDSLTLDVAINPDFSQVESDDPQVAVNQRYEVYFPEKRPFFLENSGFFSTPENLFFSRRVADPEFGARLTGKVGRWNMGFLAIDDRAPGRSADVDDAHLGDRAIIGVARVQREFGKQSSAGLMITEREFAGAYNRVGAVDTRLKLNKNWNLSAQAMTSHSRESDGSRSGGAAYNVDLFHSSRSYFYDLQYVDRAENFRTDLGYVPRTNIRQVSQFFGPRFHPKSKVILSWGPNFNATMDFDHKGVQQDWRVRQAFFVEFPRGTYVSASYGDSFERFDGANFRGRNGGLGAESGYFKKATLSFDYSRGARINYDSPEGLRAYRAHGSDLSLRLTFRFVSRLKWEEIYYCTRLNTEANSFAAFAQAPVDRPTAVFVNHLLRSRFNYQFTRALSLRAILDYNGTLPNAALTSATRAKRVSGDVLLTYLLHPGTALYLGYSDLRENLALLPGQPPSVERIRSPSTTTGRQLFAKLSYLFRF